MRYTGFFPLFPATLLSFSLLFSALLSSPPAPPPHTPCAPAPHSPHLPHSRLPTPNSPKPLRTAIKWHNCLMPQSIIG
ncbi:MAG: hypothetical protein F6K49_21540 [Moorea sp. SIO3I6]|nr:hypothetical protein [Moorena sp. SIO3I6]